MRPLPDLRTFLSLCKPGRAVPVRVEVDADTETPVSAFLKLAHGKRQAFLGYYPDIPEDGTAFARAAEYALAAL